MKTLTLICLCAVICCVYGQCGIDGELRLIETTNVENNIDNAGRLEVCLDGQWGTINADSFTTPWSEKNAQVACRQLGFSGALNSIFQNTTVLTDRADSSVPVHYSSVVCNGTESSLGDCSLNRVRGSFDHLRDVFIVCRPTTGVTFDSYSDLHSPGPNAGDIRLLGSPDNGAGAVEIYTDTIGWTGICPDSSWTDEDASVVCRTLGYNSGVARMYEITNGAIERRQASNVQCTDDRQNRLGFISAGVCSLSLFDECFIRDNVYAGVVCISSTSPPETYRLFRMTADQSSPLGIVEVLFDGRWGVICDRQFFSSEAQVMCRHLGLNPDGARTLSSAQVEGTLGEESSLKPLWLNRINCFSSSSSDITSCDRDFLVGFADCQSDNIVAIECGDGSTRLSSGAIFGIVFAVFVVLFFVVPFVWVFGKDWWSKRHDYSWYRCLTTPSEWCDCDCCSRPTRRRFELSRPAAEVTITHTHIPDTQPTPTQRQPSSSSSSDSEQQEPTHEPQDPEHEPSLTKAPPPSYRAASNFPEHTPNVDDLPPPYPGGPVPAFAYPPQQTPAPYPPGETTPYPPPAATAVPYPPGPAAPYPSSNNEQQYPPPTNPGYPPTQPSSDPAYPPVPPVTSSEVFPYPSEEPAGTNLPYPPSAPSPVDNVNEDTPPA